MSAHAPLPALEQRELTLPDSEATEQLAQKLATLILADTAPQATAAGHDRPTHPVAHIHLQGDLGAGKTCFARALLRACGVQGRIKSPSYALLESYKISSLYLHHLDFYRFSNSDEWLDAGFDELLLEPALVLIEWPERAAGRLPLPDLLIGLDYATDPDPAAGRIARLTAYTMRGRTWLTHL